MNAKTNEGATPCHTVARYGNATIATAALWALVAAGTSIHTKYNEGNTALHWAAMIRSSTEGAAAAAAALISAGADPYARNNQGKTPAALVLQRKDVASCAKLLEALLGQAGGRRGGGRRGGGGSAAVTAASGIHDLLSQPSAPPLQRGGAHPLPTHPQ